jgi:predicted permease
MLRPLPYPDAERLVEIWGTVQRQVVERRGASYPDYFDWRDQTQSFDGMASWSDGARIAYGAGEPTQVGTEVIDGPYLDLLGARPVLGRVFDRSDHQPGAAPVAVINETLWDERFNRAPDVNGRALQLGSTVYTIVGVVPARFRGRSDQAVVWTPAATTLTRNQLAARGARSFGIVARLKTGVTRAAAQDDIHAVSARLARDYPGTNEARSAEVVGLADELFRNVRPAVQLLFGIAFAVFLMAAANVASLLLARGDERQREISMRRALGSSDGRVIRLLLIESGILVVLGLGAGWLMARWLGDALLALSPVQLPSFARPGTDWRTMAFLAAIGVVTTVLFGVLPFRASRAAALSQSLREAAASARGGSRGSTLRVILMAQVAVAVVLLVSASLLSRSFVALLNFDPGFEPQGVLTSRVQLPAAPVAPAGLPGGSSGTAGALALLDQVRGLPGVTQASLTTSVPLVNAGAIFFAAENMPPVDATNRPRTYVHQVTPGHFATLGMRIIEGRDFDPSDMRPEAAVVIVSENVAKRFWPGESAVGRRLTPGDAGPKAEWRTIVGVVEEANFRGIPRNPTADPDIFIPFNARATSFAVMLRTAAEPAALASPVRALVGRLEPGAAVFGERTLASLVDQQLAQARFLSWLTSTFAVLALTLAAIGIYGTFSYWVHRRYTEIGIRSALGAGRWRLIGLVVGQAAGVAAIGVATGLAAAAAVARYLEAQLFAVQRTDWTSFAGTALVMVLAALLASLLPATRAVRIDPARTLRTPG